MITDNVMSMADEYWQEKKILLELWLDSPIGRLAGRHVREVVREKISYCEERIARINYILIQEQLDEAVLCT